MIPQAQIQCLLPSQCPEDAGEEEEGERTADKVAMLADDSAYLGVCVCVCVCVCVRYARSKGPVCPCCLLSRIANVCDAYVLGYARAIHGTRVSIQGTRVSLDQQRKVVTTTTQCFHNLTYTHDKRADEQRTGFAAEKAQRRAEERERSLREAQVIDRGPPNVLCMCACVPAPYPPSRGLLHRHKYMYTHDGFVCI